MRVFVGIYDDHRLSVGSDCLSLIELPIRDETIKAAKVGFDFCSW